MTAVCPVQGAGTVGGDPRTERARQEVAGEVSGWVAMTEQDDPETKRQAPSLGPCSAGGHMPGEAEGGGAMWVEAEAACVM